MAVEAASIIAVPPLSLCWRQAAPGSDARSSSRIPICRRISCRGCSKIGCPAKRRSALLLEHLRANEIHGRALCQGLPPARDCRPIRSSILATMTTATSGGRGPRDCGRRRSSRRLRTATRKSLRRPGSWSPPCGWASVVKPAWRLRRGFPKSERVIWEVSAECKRAADRPVRRLVLCAKAEPPESSGSISCRATAR